MVVLLFSFKGSILVQKSTKVEISRVRKMDKQCLKTQNRLFQADQHFFFFFLI